MRAFSHAVACALAASSWASPVLGANLGSASATEPKRAAPSPAHATVIATNLGGAFVTCFTLKHPGYMIYSTYGDNTIAVLKLPAVLDGKSPVLTGESSTLVWKAPDGFFSTQGSSGVLGLAIDPATFAQTGLIYFYAANRILTPTFTL